MHFYVEGKAAKGTVQVAMEKGVGEKEFRFGTLALDVPGQKRVYLEGGESVVGGVPHWGGLLVDVGGDVLDAKVDGKEIEGFESVLDRLEFFG